MSNSFVYFIHAVGTDRVKIGYSSDPDDRMAELKIGSPFPLRILHRFPGGRVEEQEIQKRFKHQRAHGEWFEFAHHQIKSLSRGLIPPPSQAALKDLLPSLPQGFWWDTPKTVTKQKLNIRWRRGGRSMSLIVPPLRAVEMETLFNYPLDEQRELLIDRIEGAIYLAQINEIASELYGMCRAQRAHR